MSSPYTAATIPSNPVSGTVVNVSCVATFVWSFAPYNSAHNATCTNVSGSGKLAHWRRRLMCRYTNCQYRSALKFKSIQNNACNCYSGLLDSDDRRCLQLHCTIVCNTGNCHVGVVSCGIHVESRANWWRTQCDLHKCERQRPVGPFRQRPLCRCVTITIVT